MATAIVRSGLRATLRGGTSRDAPSSKRSFSSSSSDEYEAREAAKWEKVTCGGALFTVLYAFSVLSKGHPHFEEPPPYEYLHVRNKEFPWGPDGLFEVKKDH